MPSRAASAPAHPSKTRCFYSVFYLYKEPSFTHVYIVLFSATMLMIGRPVGSNRVVSLSKAHLLLKSTGNTQEAVAPSQHD